MYYEHSNMYNKSQGGKSQQSYSIDPTMGAEHMASYPSKSYRSRNSSTSYRIMTITLSTFARAWGDFRAKIIMAAEISRPVSMSKLKGVQGAHSRTPWYFVLFAFLSWFHFTLNILIFRTVLGVVSFVSQLMPGYSQHTSSQCTKSHYDLSPSQLIHTTTTMTNKEETKNSNLSNDCCEDEVGDEMVYADSEKEYFPPLSPLSVIRLGEVKRKVLVLDLDETLIHSYHENNILWRQQQATPSYPSYTTTSHNKSGFGQIFNFFAPSSNTSTGRPSGDDLVSRVASSCSSNKNHSFIPFFRGGLNPQGGTKAPPGPPDFVLKVAIDRHPVRFFVYKRPHVDHFLSVVSRWYDLVVYTASMEIYGAGVADQLDQPLPLTTSSSLTTTQTILGRRYYRQHCRLEPGGTFSKDLTLVHPDPSSVAILDNSPAAYRRHPDNGIPVPSWFSDPTDRALLDLLPFLDALRFVSDVRSVLARNTHSLRTPNLGTAPILVPNLGIGIGAVPNLGNGTSPRYYANNSSTR